MEERYYGSLAMRPSRVGEIGVRALIYSKHVGHYLAGDALAIVQLI
jgi:hypothetical protein